MKLIFASNNPHKLSEVRSIIGRDHQVLGLKDVGFHKDIPENANTLEGNARIKAETIYKAFGIPCFADDTGLEVEALNNAPGVHSARYAGPSQSSSDNLKKLMETMQGIKNRNARFRTAVCLITDDDIRFFEGMVTGRIAQNATGSEGFGYDPVFIPHGYKKSFAELPAKVKNQISHRGEAIRKLAEHINFLSNPI
jgi:XTP/dITP diphosphohydrolase